MIIKPTKSKMPSAPKKRKGRARKGEGSIKLRGATWWYKIPSATSVQPPIEKSCETSDRNEALQVKARALIENGNRRRLGAVNATVGDILDGYAVYCEKECPRSWRSLRTAIKHLRKGFGSIVANELATSDTDQYRDDRVAADEVEDSTVNRELGYLKAALNREMKTTPPRVTHVPYMRLPSEKDRVREGFIERDDYQKILAKLPASLKTIFVCAFHTGARSGELKKIEWPQVNWDKRIIELRPKTTKNSDGRWIPIWGDMLEYLRWQKEIRDRDFPDCQSVFFWHKGHHQRAIPGERLKDFRWIWEEACTEAGFSDLLFHDLRRSAIKFADQKAGISPRLVRLMSGHKTDGVYNRYNIAGANDAARLAQTLDDFVRSARVVEIKRA